MKATTIFKSFFIISFLFIGGKQAFSQTEPMNNPVLMQGSSFGNFFQQLYKQGMWDEMMRFTSQKSISKFGKTNILNYYKNTDFGYQMKLKSKTNQKDGSITLNYESQIQNTIKATRINVVIENDSCKILLDNINFNLGASWK